MEPLAPEGCKLEFCRPQQFAESAFFHSRSNRASQRSLHNAPIFRLLLKVAVNGTHQCDFCIFAGRKPKPEKEHGKPVGPLKWCVLSFTFAETGNNSERCVLICVGASASPQSTCAGRQLLPDVIETSTSAQQWRDRQTTALVRSTRSAHGNAEEAIDDCTCTRPLLQC